MNEIEKLSAINYNNINDAQYFESFLQEYYRIGLLSDLDLEKIQFQIIDLLAKKTTKYTQGDSSSVPLETAQNLLHSITYVIGIHLKNIFPYELRSDELKGKTITEHFQQGRAIISIKVEEALQNFNLLQENKIITENIAYNDTINNGLQPFFDSYDPDFFANQTPSSIDYPISNPKQDLVGIEYMWDYTQKLNWENQFCSLFPSENIEDCLRGYDEQYQHLLLNIFDHVLMNALGCALVNNDPIELNILPKDRDRIIEILLPLSKNNRDTLLVEKTLQLCSRLNIGTPLLDYIVTSVRRLGANIYINLSRDLLESVFVTVKEPPNCITFQDEEKMDDEAFRKVIDEINQCRLLTDKVAIIQQEIRSIGDLIDLFESHCIDKQELLSIYKTLNNTVLALLIKSSTLNYHEDFTNEEFYKDWEEELAVFLNQMDQNRSQTIVELSKRLVFD